MKRQHFDAIEVLECCFFEIAIRSEEVVGGRLYRWKLEKISEKISANFVIKYSRQINIFMF